MIDIIVETTTALAEAYREIALRFLPNSFKHGTEFSYQWSNV
jgi:hypothetical protein